MLTGSLLLLVELIVHRRFTGTTSTAEWHAETFQKVGKSLFMLDNIKILLSRLRARCFKGWGSLLKGCFRVLSGLVAGLAVSTAVKQLHPDCLVQHHGAGLLVLRCHLLVACLVSTDQANWTTPLGFHAEWPTHCRTRRLVCYCLLLLLLEFMDTLEVGQRRSLPDGR